MFERKKHDEEGGVPSLKLNGKALKEMFNFYGIILPTSPCGVSAKFFQELDGVSVPTTKSLDNEGFRGSGGRAVRTGSSSLCSLHATRLS